MSEEWGTCQILIGITLPITARAITPGHGADVDCQVWREGDPTDIRKFCEGKYDTNKRLYELEVLITELQSQNSALKNQVNNIVVNTSQPQKVVETKEVIIQDPDNSRVEQLENKSEELEKRVSSLENAVKFLAEKVMAAITITINLLKELLNKL